jgi:integrase/recombinase XerD
MLARYSGAAELPHNMPPHRLRHFLFTWLKTQGIDDALIQPYSSPATRQSLGGSSLDNPGVSRT